MKWFKRIVIAIAVIFALGFGTPFVYVQYAKNQADIAPQEYPDLEPSLTPLPEGAINALAILEPIAESIQEHDEHQDWENHDHSSADHDISVALSQQHAEWLAKVQAALEHPMQSKHDFTIDAGYSDVLGLFTISRFLKFKAQSLLVANRQSAAFEIIKTQLRLHNSSMHIEGSMVTILTQFAIHNNSIDSVATFLDQPDINATQLEELSSIFQHLLRPHKNLENSIKCEYQTLSHSLTLLEPAEKNPLYKPNKTRDEIAEIYRKHLQISRVPAHKDHSHIKFDKINKPYIYLSSNPIGRSLVYSSVISPSSYTTVHQSAIPFATTLIALRHYQLDHGDLPERLAQLVPRYLSQIPIDPYANALLNYSKENRILWSIGNDFTNDHGKHPDHKADRAVNFTPAEPSARFQF